ncbi:MAG: sulfatase [Cyclobacteriaceae bacterium]|nr:sulfatase [Cyclobacteriaceae bacterium]
MINLSRNQLFAVVILITVIGISCDSKYKKPNVVLICVDDLRTDLGCYGVETIRTPNIDKLASQGRLFSNHYVFMAACGPSRSTLLGGQRSYSWDYLASLRKEIKNNDFKEPQRPVSMPHLFKQNGYRTVCIGKVSHIPGGKMEDGMLQLPYSWSEVYCPGTDKWKSNWGAEFAYVNGEYYNSVIFKEELDVLEPRLPYERGRVDDFGYPDALNAEKAIVKLKELKDNEDPFFLAVGFYKPHLPFNAPEPYWSMYDSMNVAVPAWPFPPENTKPELTLHDSYEPTSHYYWPSGKGNINKSEGNVLNQGYWASVSYVDAQIGRVLEGLNKLGLDKTTIVVLWGDHGWHLGDYGIWGKYTLYEQSVKSPLIIRMPNDKYTGIHSEAIVETVDIYPTIAQLCGLDYPDDLDGESFSKTVTNPLITAREYAYSVVPRNSAIGHTLRSERYRFMQWIDRETGDEILYELYDHKNDPAESKNIAKDHPDLVNGFAIQIENVKMNP